MCAATVLLEIEVSYGSMVLYSVSCYMVRLNQPHHKLLFKIYIRPRRGNGPVPTLGPQFRPPVNVGIRVRVPTLGEIRPVPVRDGLTYIFRNERNGG